MQVRVKDALRQLVHDDRLYRRSGKAVICIARWTERDGRSNGRRGRRSNIKATTCRRPRRCFIVCSTSNSGGSTPGWRACSRAMAANNTWPSSSAWMWTPLPGAEPSFSAVKCCAGGCVKQEPGDVRWEKTPENLEPTARLAVGGHGGRSHAAPGFVDRQTLASHRPGTGPAWPAGLPQHGPPVAGTIGLLRPECLPRKRPDGRGATEDHPRRPPRKYGYGER